MIKKIIFLVTLLVYLTTYSQVKENLIIPKNPRIGLSLSGGGAKGFSHIGVLKVIDSLGIKIDYVSGTSMGAIVGGLYASGYKGKEIEKIVMDTDFFSLITDPKSRQEATFFNKNVDKYILTIPFKNGKITLPSSISTGQRNIYLLKELLRNVSNINDFRKLPIPFLCVATNIESGDMKIFEKGDLVSSILASSAFPSLLEPVKIGDSIYVDGAMSVNYPSKPLKDKGIDIVIGVDLNQPLNKREDLNSIISILNQIIDFGIQKETKYQYKFTDINIRPDLTNMTSTSYGEKKTILDSGYVEALKYVDILNKLPKTKNDRLRSPVNSTYSSVYKIDSIATENSSIYSKNYMRGKMGLKIPSMQTYGSINKMLDKLYATNNYKFLSYDIAQDKNVNYLKIYATEEESRHFFKLGLHYDDIFKTGLLLNYSAKRLLFQNSSLSLDLIVGDKPRYYFNYFVDNGYIPGVGIYSSGMNFDMKNSKRNIIESWNWFTNQIYIQSVWKDRFALGGGIRYDFFKRDRNGEDKSTEKYVNPYLFLRSDTQNDKDFPTKGFYLNTEVMFIDIFSDNLKSKPILVKIDLKNNFYLGKYLTYRLNLFIGSNTENDTPYFYKFRVGGIFEQNIANFKSLPGYQFGIHDDNNVAIISNDLQFRFNKNYYLIGNFTYAALPDYEKLKSERSLSFVSVGLTAGYKSPFGQIKLNVSKALIKQNPIFSVILGHWF